MMENKMCTNVRSFFGKVSPSTLLHSSFSFIIKNYLEIKAEEEGFLISSSWMSLFAGEKDIKIAGYLNWYQYLESKWSTELDFCNTDDVGEINTSFEKELTDLLLILIDYTEKKYGPVYIEK